MINERRGPTWSDVLLPTLCRHHPEVLQQASETLGLFCIVLIPRIRRLLCSWLMRPSAQCWQAFSRRDTPDTDLLKSVSHLNIRGLLITLHFLPVLQLRRSAGYCEQLTSLLMHYLWAHLLRAFLLLFFVLDTAFKSPSYRAMHDFF